MLDGELVILAGLVRLLHQLADRHRISCAANSRVKTAIRTVIAHCGQVVIAEAVSEDTFERVAGKALKFEIGLGEESAAFRSLPFYREKNVEMRVDLIPDHLNVDSGRISAEQVADEKARLLGKIFGRKLMIHTATSESALMRGHTDDRAALVVLVQGFDMPEGVVEFLDGRAVRLQVVQTLCPFIMEQTCALSASSNHPLDRSHLPIEERPWLRFPADRIHNFRIALDFFNNRIKAGEIHGDERHFLEHRSWAALGEITVVVRGRDLPV